MLHLQIMYASHQLVIGSEEFARPAVDLDAELALGAADQRVADGEDVPERVGVEEAELELVGVALEQQLLTQHGVPTSRFSACAPPASCGKRHAPPSRCRRRSGRSGPARRSACPPA